MWNVSVLGPSSATTKEKKSEWPENKRTLREMALEVGLLEMKGNEDDVNRSKQQTTR